MRGLDILCKANIICDNTDTVSLDNGLFRSIPAIESLTARLNKAALKEGRKLGFEVEKISLAEESLGLATVRYLLIERDADGLNGFAEDLTHGLENLGLVMPKATFRAFYHPVVSVQASDGDETQFVPEGRSFMHGDSAVIEFNIARSPTDLIDQIAREVTFFAISEKAISMPSHKLANDYHRSILSGLPRSSFARLEDSFERKVDDLEEVFAELSSRLEDGGADFLSKLETFIRRVESFPRKLVG